MIRIRGITTCVGYAGFLSVTLPRNMRHLRECLVITSGDDADTISLCRSIPSVRLHITDAFTRHGAKFNKGLAMEEGFDVLGRHGWILIWDADCLMPDTIYCGAVQSGRLYGCRRRICANPSEWSPGMPWHVFRLIRDGGPIGFFQLFDGEDPALCNKRPWYDVSFAHAAGGDAYFITHWPPFKHTVLNMDVLHLGPAQVNWFGTDEESRRVMRAYRVRNGWKINELRVDMNEVNSVGDIDDRVVVPGYPPSNYELPFVKRTKEIAAGKASKK